MAAHGRDVPTVPQEPTAEPRAAFPSGPASGRQTIDVDGQARFSAAGAAHVTGRRLAVRADEAVGKLEASNTSRPPPKVDQAA